MLGVYRPYWLMQWGVGRGPRCFLDPEAEVPDGGRGEALELRARFCRELKNQIGLDGTFRVVVKDSLWSAVVCGMNSPLKAKEERST